MRVIIGTTMVQTIIIESNFSRADAGLRINSTPLFLSFTVL